MKRVYFIKPIGMRGPIKIGCSAAPDNRRRTLDTWSPFRLEIIAEIAGGEAIERRFHARFASLHERREWFSWSIELQAVIDQISAGSFDIASLPAPQLLPRSAANRAFMTPAWKYARSVQSRVRALEARGMKWKVALDAGVTTIARCDPDDLEAVKAHFEPIVAEWQRQFPHPRHRISPVVESRPGVLPCARAADIGGVA